MKSKEQQGGQEGGGHAQGVGRALLPCGPLGGLLTKFFRPCILLYPKTIRKSHENTFPPPQPSVPMRSHLGAFSSVLPEGDSITEGFYINTIALLMKHE